MKGDLKLLTSTIYHKGKFLLENELMPPEKSCSFCLSENRMKVANIQKNPDVYLYECLQCHAVSASRMPFKEVLDLYYSSYYDKNRSQVTAGNIDQFAKHLYNGFSKHLSQGDTFSILDFGGGNGSIAYALAKDYLLKSYKNVSIAVIDYAGIKESDIPTISLKQYQSLSQIDGEEFNLIIASAILEHIPYPEADIRKLFALLKKNGLFYARTPYILPFYSLLQRLGVQIDFTFPAHLHDLGPKFWNKTVNKLYDNYKFRTLRSGPSMVETSFHQDFVRALVAHLFKWPWYLFRDFYGYIGGWEAFIIKSELVSAYDK